MPDKQLPPNWVEKTDPEDPESGPYYYNLVTSVVSFEFPEDTDAGDDDDADTYSIPPKVRDSEKVPVTIVTGFLGSGKTTLVNHVIRRQQILHRQQQQSSTTNGHNHTKAALPQHPTSTSNSSSGDAEPQTNQDDDGDAGSPAESNPFRIGIIENEYGQVSIDDEILRSSVIDPEKDIIAIDHGCICCTNRASLTEALYRFAEKEVMYDSVIIETTGLADPGPVIFAFNDPELSTIYRIDGVICVVDAKNAVSNMRKDDLQVNDVVRQIAYADCILLNKTDLATEQELTEAQREIKSINQFANVTQCVKSNVPLENVFGIRSFSIERADQIEQSLKDRLVVSPAPPTSSEGSGGDHARPSKRAKVAESAATTENGTNPRETDSPVTHSQRNDKLVVFETSHNLSGVSSFGMELTGTIHRHRFDDFLTELLHKSDNLYRMKGVISFSRHNNMKTIFQGVREQIIFGTAQKPWGPDETRVCKLVFIGCKLDKEWIETGLVGCLYAPGEEEPEDEQDYYESSEE